MISWLCSVWFKINGWKIVGTFPHELPKIMLAVGPHTSAWDVVVGLATRQLVPIKHAYFLGKKELFDGPFGWFFRAIGGTPVDRFSKTGMVEQVAEKFNTHEFFRLGISPEGTRKKVDKLKTGFYHISKQANIPIMLVGFDFTKKQVIFGDIIYPSNDEAADFKKIHAFFATVDGKFPKQGLKHLV